MLGEKLKGWTERHTKKKKSFTLTVCIITELNVKHYLVLILGIHKVLSSCFPVVHISWDWC